MSVTLFNDVLRWQGRLIAARMLRDDARDPGLFARRLEVLRDLLGLPPIGGAR